MRRRLLSAQSRLQGWWHAGHASRVSFMKRVCAPLSPRPTFGLTPPAALLAMMEAVSDRILTIAGEVCLACAARAQAAVLAAGVRLLALPRRL